MKTILLNVIICVVEVLSQNANMDDVSVTCDSLSSQGTSLLCTLPQNRGTTDCSQLSIPGTIASYACRGPTGEVLRGFLSCNKDGIWISSLKQGHNSLCGLEAAIINIQSPDIAVATNSPGFTTPAPDLGLLQQDLTGLEDYQKVALQLHNTFRRNHRVPFVGMSPLLNEAAQDLVNFITFGNSSIPTDPTRRLALLNVTLNIESNWYLQEPQASSKIEAVSNAVQSWYATGFQTYNWQNVASNLENSEALAFSRVIWRVNKFVGIGITNFNGVTFVVCIYTPGRDVSSNDPVSQFQNNVPPVLIRRPRT